MTTRFAKQAQLVTIRARLAGPLGERSIVVAVDTGATFTLIQPDILRSVGVEPRPDGPTLDIVTTSTTERSRMAPVVWLAALGVRRDRMLVVSHTLPLAVRLDGLLGLDFLRDHRLTIDFREGTIDLD